MAPAKKKSRKPKVPSLPRLVEKREYHPTNPKRIVINARYSMICTGTQSDCRTN